MTEPEFKQYLEELKNEIITAITKQISKPEKQLLTIREAAEYLGVSYKHLSKI